MGILAGFNTGDIRSSSASGTVSGRDHTGGLAGWNEGSITHSRTDATVKGSMFVGGLAGYNSGTIDGSYVHGSVNGSYESGGLAGVNEQSGKITASYASGMVASGSVTGGCLDTTAVMSKPVTGIGKPHNKTTVSDKATRISYSLPAQTHVRLVVYNLLGQPVVTLVDGIRDRGMHMATFDAGGLAGGAYLYRIQTGTNSMTRSMILLK